MLSGELWGMGHEAEAVPKGVPCFSGWGKFYAIGLPIGPGPLPCCLSYRSSSLRGLLGASHENPAPPAPFGDRSICEIGRH